MKEYYLDFFRLTFVLAIPDGSDGWLWRCEHSKESLTHHHTDFFRLSMVYSRLGWTGIELIILPLVLLVKWYTPSMEEIE